MKSTILVSPQAVEVHDGACGQVGRLVVLVALQRVGAPAHLLDTFYLRQQKQSGNTFETQTALHVQ